jgi:hypothetical protein
LSVVVVEVKHPFASRNGVFAASFLLSPLCSVAFADMSALPQTVATLPQKKD